MKQRVVFSFSAPSINHESLAHRLKSNTYGKLSHINLSIINSKAYTKYKNGLTFFLNRSEGDN